MVGTQGRRLTKAHGKSDAFEIIASPDIGVSIAKDVAVCRRSRYLNVKCLVGFEKERVAVVKAPVFEAFSQTVFHAD